MYFLLASRVFFNQMFRHWEVHRARRPVHLSYTVGSAELCYRDGWCYRCCFYWGKCFLPVRMMFVWFLLPFCASESLQRNHSAISIQYTQAESRIWLFFGYNINSISRLIRSDGVTFFTQNVYFFLKEINTFIWQGCFKLLKSDSADTIQKIFPIKCFYY